MSNISNKIIASEQNSNSLTNNVSNDALFINDYITIAIEFPNKPSNIFKIIQSGWATYRDYRLETKRKNKSGHFFRKSFL